ncbi:MAG TPA: MarR family transcriptional regulator [Longimicrobiales bacterium]|nr:MarR family transcriptional regulator [Longimicrobiales bacterium]
MDQERPSARVSGIMDSLRRLVRELRVASRAAERELGISGAQLFVLQQLHERPADSVNELSERTHTHQSSVSVVVSRLVDRGLIIREPSEEDGRRMTLRLSAEGRKLLERAPRTVQSRLIEALGRLPADVRTALASGLEAWTREAGISGEPAPFFFEDERPSGPRGRRRGA